MGFLMQQYWSGLPFLSPWGLPDPGIEHTSPALADILYYFQGSPYEPLGQAKWIHSGRIQNGDWLPLLSKDWLAQETFNSDVFNILVEVVVTLVYVFIETHGIGPLQSVHFTAHFTSKIGKTKALKG